MLTPAFELSQTDEHLIVCIQAPYAEVSKVEVDFEDKSFMFYSKPYYLRLNLPASVKPCDEQPLIKYDFDKRLFTIHAPKAERGEIFEDLDLITLLLSSKKEKAINTPKIEVIDGESIEIEDDDFDWTIEQIPSSDTLGDLDGIYGQQCGFANSYSFSVFSLKEEASEIFDVHDPQMKSSETRSQERLQMENKQFSEDHYIADLYEDEEIRCLLKYRPDWETILDECQKSNISDADVKINFTSDEKDCLRKLPCKEYLLDKSQVRTAFLGLLDILFAYAYNKRTTNGENTVESGWTINKISATLSFLEVFHSVSDVALSCIRRSLCYPLYRHFELSVTLLEDVRKILLLGRKYVIKCLLEIHGLFNESEPRYILNDLFITDYCVWMQSKRCSSSKLLPIADAIGKILLTKGDIGFHLVDIESFAKIAWMAQEHSNTLTAGKSKDENPPSERSQEGTGELCDNLEKLSVYSDVEKDQPSAPEQNNKVQPAYDSESTESSDCSSSTIDSDSSVRYDSSDSDNSEDDENFTFDTIPNLAHI